ncbi:MAG: biotin/lipoyl-binding protein [Holophagales bacterium]|nr:biotin/lipoyl-binding protein [Holophagales bacterium]
MVPESERVLASPIDARVLRVLKRPGAAVKAGEAVAELDTTQPALAVERLLKELRMKEAQNLRAQLTLEGTLSSLESQVKVKELTLSTYGANLARNRRLFAEGLVSEEQLRQTELDEARTRVELTQPASRCVSREGRPRWSGRPSTPSSQRPARRPLRPSGSWPSRRRGATGTGS